MLKKNMASFVVLGLIVLLQSCVTQKNLVTENNIPNKEDVDALIKEELLEKVEKRLIQLGKKDGYFNDSITITFPEKYIAIENTLRGIQLGEYPDEIILKLNRVAEKSTSKSREFILSTIDCSTIKDFPSSNDSLIITNEIHKSVIEYMESELANDAWSIVFEKYNQIPFIIKKDTPNIINYETNAIFDVIIKYISMAKSSIIETNLIPDTPLIE